MKKTKKCPICKSINTKKDATITHDKYLSITIQYYACNSCKTRFINPIPKKQLTALYKDSFRKEITFKQKIIFSLPFSPRFRKKIEFVDELPKGNLLDIGSSEGKFMNLMRRKGWSVEGVEPNKIHSDFCNKFFGIKTYNMFLEKLETKKKYDLITLLETLEHLYEPLKMLKLIRPLLEEKGHVLITVPHNCHLFSAHIFAFSKQGIKTLLKQAGLKLTKMKEVPYPVGKTPCLLILAEKTTSKGMISSEMSPREQDLI